MRRRVSLESKVVRRIVELISQIFASGPGMTLRATAEVALAAVASQFPGSGAVLLERDSRVPETMLVIAGVNVPEGWRARKIPLSELPFVSEALAARERTVTGTTWLRLKDRREMLQVICGAVPTPGEPLYVVALVGGCVKDEISTYVDTLEVVRRLLSWSPPPAGSQRARILAAIVDAKQEWERTADALPELVGLVDRSRRVLRINRALERWSLGTVQDAVGRDVHRVLHPRCDGAHCDLNLLLEGAFEKLACAPTASFELADPVCEMDLVVVLNTAADSSAPVGPGSWENAALIVSNVTSLRRAERELKLLNRALEQRVADRTARLTGINRALREEIARRRAAEESLRDSKVELEALSDRLVNAQEEERKRIAQDLHDSVGQGMSAIKYSLERASLLAHRDKADQAVHVVDNAIERTQGVIDEVRAISMNLRPAALDDLGAVSAIRSFCRDWREVYNTVVVKADIAVTDQDIPPSIVTNVYRAVQESLNNVARHAHARCVWVSMRISSGKLVVKIRDDGVGFDVHTREVRGRRPALLGLRGLKERTERSGGCCTVTSAPGKGTTVRLEWPVAIGRAARDANARLN
jgi:signal transduction histidine kinase/PAS domain-containing protein